MCLSKRLANMKSSIMKYNYKKLLRQVSVAARIVTLVAGCKKADDFFDLSDPNGIDSDIWNDEGAVNLYLNKGYDLMMPDFPVPGSIHNTSDETNSANTAF